MSCSGGHIWPTFPLNFLRNFHRKCLSTSSIPCCKKVKSDQKLKSRGSCLKTSESYGERSKNHYNFRSCLITIVTFVKPAVTAQIVLVSVFTEKKHGTCIFFRNLSLKDLLGIIHHSSCFPCVWLLTENRKFLAEHFFLSDQEPMQMQCVIHRRMHMFSGVTRSFWWEWLPWQIRLPKGNAFFDKKWKK